MHSRTQYSKNRDFICHLHMPRNFNEQMARPVEDYVFNFLKDWIMYKWLETKMPDAAAVFFANCETYREKIRGALNMRDRPTRRYHGYY